MVICDRIVNWILCSDDWADSSSMIIEAGGRMVISVLRTLWASVIISIVNDPEERTAEKEDIESAKEDEVEIGSPDGRDNT